MASKIHTDDPHHHKYVTVNKRERKKHVKRPVNLLSLLFERWLHKPVAHRLAPYWYHRSYRYRSDHRPYHTKGTIIVWDDCNHKTFRVLKHRKTRKGGYGFIKRRYYPNHITWSRVCIPLWFSDGVAHFRRT